ncbi:hypothetical protein AUJ14_05760 [Candidatus Micrarchaeota archaeon CG1_02_55_22]|nr:MAG: hypothetical protein AUJ14_05760 [Candidatus Micrarchaeota archaeon CG1_02_55_22]
MPFDFDFTDELKLTLSRLAKRNKPLAEEVKKKVRQVTASDGETVEHYKNLRHDLKNYKRVHVGSFVLFFRVFKEENFILFDRLAHHDDAYKR